MRIVYIGTSDIAVPALLALIEKGHEVAAVITQSDKGSGRGKNIRFSPVKDAALQNGILLLQPERIGEEEVLEKVRTMGPDLFVVASYAQKIPEEFITLAPYGCINIHPSLLPKYRGAAPLAGPILNGDEETGVSIMRIAEKLDSGNILAQEKIRLDPKETAQTLERKTAELGAGLLLSVIEGLEKGSVEEIEQKEEDATYIRQIAKEEGRIDFSEPAEVIERKIRAFIPWPSAYTTLEGKTFKIWAADVTAAKVPEDKRCPLHETCHPHGAGEEAILPGTVTYADKKTLIVKCGKGCLSLTEVQLEGKKRMTVEEFLRGRKIEKGFVFGE